MKIPIIQKQDYTIYFEPVEDVIFVHCDVYRWCKSSKLALLKDSETLHTLHNATLYAYHIVGDEKHLKFLKLTGFSPVKTGIGRDLKLIQIFKKEVPNG